MEANYLIPVNGQELLSSELTVTTALMLGGGFFKNKASVTVKSARAEQALKLACSVLHLRCETLKSDPCKSRFYIRPISKLSCILAKQQLIPDFESGQQWSTVRQHLPSSWKGLTVTQRKHVLEMARLFSSKTMLDGKNIIITKYDTLAEELRDLFGQAGFIHYLGHGYSFTKRRENQLIYKCTDQPDPSCPTDDTAHAVDDDIQDLL